MNVHHTLELHYERHPVTLTPRDRMRALVPIVVFMAAGFVLGLIVMGLVWLTRS